MPQISPFRGLRFDPARVGEIGDVLCPPYDVISPAEQQQLLDRSPYNIIRVELSRDAEGDSKAANRYTRAAADIASWEQSGVLRRDVKPAYYLVAHTFSWAGKAYTRRGLFVAVRLRPWSDGAVLPHEATFSGPKEDRYKLLSATNTNVSPVFMVYRDQPAALSEAWERYGSGPATVEASMDDERQRIWVVDDDALVARIAAQLEGQPQYIADGHHRYETALRVRDERSATGNTPEETPAGFVLTYIVHVDDPGLVVLPTHRVVRGLPVDRVRALISADGSGFSTETVSLSGADSEASLQSALARLAERGRSGPSFGLLGSDTDGLTIVTLTDPGVMERAAPEQPAAWRSLDVSVLQTLILDPLLPAHGERDASITYSRDERDAIKAVRSGQSDVAFLMNTPSVAGMTAVAEARARMPEKSTYFYPKVPTGLVLHSIR